MILLNNTKLRKKITVFTVLMVIIMAIIILIFYFYEKKVILEKTKSELYNTNNAIVNMVKTSAKISVRSYLKALAKGTVFTINQVYEEYEEGKLTKEEAMEMISKVILAQKIGKSGYAYIVNSKGILLVHPYKILKNTDISEQEFFQKQAMLKKGYFEYEWKNPGDLEKRKKALYMEYFKEWDLIVSETVYRDEFEDLVNPDDFREEVLSVKFGENGYSYVITDKGIVKIHPNYKAGTDWYDVKDSKGNEFLKEICEKKNGVLTYFWKTPNEDKEEEKFVVYQYIPELKWIVVSGSYKKEYLKPVNDMKIMIMITFVLLICLYIFQQMLLEKLVIKPIHELIIKIRHFSGKNKQMKNEIKNKDEIKELFNEFNTLIESVGNYETHLKDMVETKTLESRKAYEKLKKISYLNKKNEELLDTIIQTIPDPIFYKDENFKYVKCNSAFEKYLGKTKEEIYGKTVYDISPKELADIYHEKDLELFNRNKEQKYEACIKNSLGELRNVIFNKAVCFIDGDKKGIVGVIQDITELRKLENELKELSIRDALTGLYNRRGLEELGLALFGYSIRRKEKITVFMIDIDNFKLYNDEYGHQAGDYCLKLIGKSINDCCYRPMDLAVRYGGEEFIVLLMDIDEKGALEVAERIGNNIRGLKIEHSGNIKEKIITVSIGVFIGIPEKMEDMEKFIQKADEKLYIAKAKGKGIVEM